MHDAPVLHDGDAIGEPDRLVEIVGDEHDGLLQHRLEAQEFVLHLPPDQRIERGERLVEKPDVGVGGERAGDADALLLAAGKLVRQIALTALEPDESGHLARARLALLARNALDLERKGDIVEHGEMRQEREVLKHHAHLVTAEFDQLLPRGIEQVAAGEDDFAGGRLDQAREASHQRRLAGAGKSHDDEDLAARDVERRVGDGGDVARVLQLRCARRRPKTREQALRDRVRRVSTHCGRRERRLSRIRAPCPEARRARGLPLD